MPERGNSRANDGQWRFVGRAALAFLGIIAIVCLFGIGLVNRVIVRPINTLSQAARQYAGNRKAFSALKLSGGDEIGVLAASMYQHKKAMKEQCREG